EFFGLLLLKISPLILTISILFFCPNIKLISNKCLDFFILILLLINEKILSFFTYINYNIERVLTTCLQRKYIKKSRNTKCFYFSIPSVSFDVLNLTFSTLSNDLYVSFCDV